MSDFAKNIPGFSLCNGDETHESWKPLLNTIHAFRGSSECLHNETGTISLIPSITQSPYQTFFHRNPDKSYDISRL